MKRISWSEFKKRTRQETVAVRFTKEELAVVREQADQHGLSVAVYVRMLVIKEVRPIAAKEVKA